MKKILALCLALLFALPLAARAATIGVEWKI